MLKEMCAPRSITFLEHLNIYGDKEHYIIGISYHNSIPRKLDSQ